jgi:spermidine synthase
MVIDHMGHGISDRDEPRWLHGSYGALSDRLVRLRGIAEGSFSAFFVGGGAYTLPRAWLHAFPEARLTVAELDPEVTRVAREQFWLEDSERLEVLHGDARRLLAMELAGKRYDVVVGDAFHDISVPAHLTTREFARAVRERLTPRGIYLLHVVDLASDPRFLLAEVRTLDEVFPEVELWVDRRQWDVGGRISFIIVAGSDPTPAGFLRGQSPDDLAEQRAWQRLPARSVRKAATAAASPVLTDDLAPVDRLMFHVLQRDP